MYKIEAIVRPDRLGFVKEALVDQGYDEFAVTEVHGHGAQPGPTARYRGVAYELPFVHEVNVELAVPDTSLDVVIDCIIKAARTGKAGDGKIFVTPLDEVIEIGIGAPVAAAESRSNARPRLAATADAGWSSAW
jgi:nitrogen regulatory protein P-II 1